MSPETFSFLYNLGSTLPDGTTTYSTPGPASTFTLTDDLDGSNDDATAVGGLLSLTIGGTTDPVVFVGFSSNNEPVVFDGNLSLYFLLSDDDTLTGNIGFTDSGTYTYCFAGGTLISTANGEVAVERLSIGDHVVTSKGTTVPVKWVGRQTMKKMFSGQSMQPICIKSGALGDGLPHSDLTVTPDHAIIIDDYAINASALVNGVSIDWVPMADLDDIFCVYHVETEDHDVILANGACAETFIDAADRKNFDNYDEYIELYGVERVVPEMNMRRICSSRLVPQTIKARLLPYRLENEQLAG
ncbi:hypothetical protein GCM10007385_40410 [Tateyamaria omphalii]|uniref:Hint domain-containing protein n=1 Tax=Tateyamaria omphalii TaxID=299262 RepID=UPI0019862A88|nr:Hint domain-containing protein [Tateyamaria omphalii]GGX67239.1 hypothetical protein GCM10007385_40410 [Tateyamaria omphalii]